MRKSFTTLVLAAGIVLGSATAASAYPVPEDSGTYCVPPAKLVVGHCETPRVSIFTPKRQKWADHGQTAGFALNHAITKAFADGPR